MSVCLSLCVSLSGRLLNRDMQNFPVSCSCCFSLPFFPCILHHLLSFHTCIHAHAFIHKIHNTYINMCHTYRAFTFCYHGLFICVTYIIFGRSCNVVCLSACTMTLIAPEAYKNESQRARERGNRFLLSSRFWCDISVRYKNGGLQSWLFLYLGCCCNCCRYYCYICFV